MAVIVDTDVVSFLLKKDFRAEIYRTHLEGLSKTISFYKHLNKNNVTFWISFRVQTLVCRFSRASLAESHAEGVNSERSKTPDLLSFSARNQ